MDDLQALASTLNANSNYTEPRDNVINDTAAFFIPLPKQKKKGHYICQRLELSIMGDKSESSKDLANKLFGSALTKETENSDLDDDIIDKLDGKIGGLGLGANFGYSLIFVPGHRDEVSSALILNRFGFGYSVGFISQFDHEKNSGVSWDFLGKVGVETGFNKAIGVGFDFLFGGGKTSQTVIDFGAVYFGDVEGEGESESDPDPDDLLITTESLWCAKVGTQLWLRLNFLTRSINNFDIALLSRFVYSFRPYSEEEINKRILNYCELPVWQHEAWSFGVTMTYFF